MHPVTGEWIKKLRHIYIYIYIYIHTHIHTHTYIGSEILLSHKKNEIMAMAATWMDLEIIIPSEAQIMTNTV